MPTETDPTIHEITDPDAVEVSVVDRPANQEPFLLIKSAAGGEPLKLPIDAEAIVALATSLGDSGDLLAKLGDIVAKAVSEDGATFPESLTAEITKAVELLGEHYKPAEVEKPAEKPDAADDLEKNLDPITAFMVTVQAIREKLGDVRGLLDEDPNGALLVLQQVIGMLSNAIATYPSAVPSGSSHETGSSHPSMLALAADDLAKCREGIPDTDVQEAKEVVRLLKQLEFSIRPAASVQKAFDAFRTEATARESVLEKQNQRLRQALQEAVALVKSRVTPLAKAIGPDPRPAPQSSVESVLSQVDLKTTQPAPVNWGSDLAAEVVAEESAARRGR